MVCFCGIAPVCFAEQFNDPAIDQYETALVVYDRSTARTINLNPVRSAQLLSPCSTFKIYNTLIGLELGLIKGADEPWYQWDRVKRDIEGWNQDLTLRQAFRMSAVPAYQILARQIGETRMKRYIDEMRYGTQDISAGIDIFWLPRFDTASIKISAEQQVDLLNKLLDNKLPFSKKNVAILRDIMLVEKTSKGTLYGKTGSGMGADQKWNLGWFVGFLEHEGSIHVFACNIIGGPNPSGLQAKKIVIDYFKARGFL